MDEGEDWLQGEAPGNWWGNEYVPSLDLDDGYTGGLPWWLNLGSIPGLGRSPGEENGNTHWYSCLESSWTEEPGWLESVGSQRVGHNWATNINRTQVYRCRGRSLLEPLTRWWLTLQDVCKPTNNHTVDWNPPCCTYLCLRAAHRESFLYCKWM